MADNGVADRLPAHFAHQKIELTGAGIAAFATDAQPVPATPVARTRLVQAGLRLARVLDAALN